jgi:hypothetical protein
VTHLGLLPPALQVEDAPKAVGQFRGSSTEVIRRMLKEQQRETQAGPRILCCWQPIL